MYMHEGFKWDAASTVFIFCRINALVEQEVKRRLFEEKKQRENVRKQEREKERVERDLEIQKLKEQHSREIKQLKAKFEADQEISRYVWYWYMGL